MQSAVCIILVLSTQSFQAFAVSSGLVRNAKASSIDADGEVNPVSFRTAPNGLSLMSMSVSAWGDSQPEFRRSFASDQALETKVQEMLNDVEDATKSGAKPEQDWISTIKSIVVDSLLPDLKATRDAAQKQVKKLLAGIDTCNADALKQLSNVKGTTEVAVGGARTAHATCREAEKGKNSTKSDKCQELDDFLNAINVPSKIPTGRPRDQMVTYVKTMSTYFCPKGPTVTTLDEACTLATSQHSAHKSDCDGKQAAFEIAFCTWRTELNDACIALSSCYKGALGLYNDYVSDTKELVKKWKTEFSALNKILCYVNVWLSDNNSTTVDQEQFAKCKVQTADTSVMDVDFGTPADQAECSMAAVENHPGTDGFVTTEYASFADYVVATMACLPLPTGAPVTPPATTAAPTEAPTTTLPEGHGFDGKHITHWMIQKQYNTQAKGLCGLELDTKVDALYSSGDGGDWVKYFKSGSRNAGCGGACNGDNGINIECHYIGVSKGNLRGVNAFAKTYLVSDADKSVKLYLGSDDGIAVWVNGKNVFQNLKACHCYADKQFSADIQLKKGVNLLVIKTGENDGHFGFTAQLDNTDGIQAAEAATYTPE